MQSFIAGLPKAELHVHVEGTLEPHTIFSLAERNGIELPYESPDALLRAYDFDDLPSFLKIYYTAMDVLRTPEDFYQMTMAYFEKAAAQNIRYVEMFFDPQGHTRRGIAFDTVFEGIHGAVVDARSRLGLEARLIMCFLRDLSAESAAETLAAAEPYRDRIIGVGLDSDEKDNPPLKFREVFARARELGFRLTMHCDVNQEDSIEHIRDCIGVIGVDRIDHGINALEDEAVCRTIAERGFALTVCPVSNRFVVQTLTGTEIRELTRRGIKVTINSDDPAYFRAYLNENLQALVDDAGFERDEIVALVRNAFETSWADAATRRAYLDEVDRYVASAA